MALIDHPCLPKTISATHRELGNTAIELLPTFFALGLLLILNREIEAPEPEIIPLRQFQPSTVPAETFHLYRVEYPPGRRPEPSCLPWPPASPGSKILVKPWGICYKDLI